MNAPLAFTAFVAPHLDGEGAWPTRRIAALAVAVSCAVKTHSSLRRRGSRPCDSQRSGAWCSARPSRGRTRRMLLVSWWRLHRRRRLRQRQSVGIGHPACREKGTDLTTKTVARKARVKPGTRIAVLHPGRRRVVGTTGRYHVGEATPGRVGVPVRAVTGAARHTHAGGRGCPRPQRRDLGVLPQGLHRRGLHMNRDDVWAVAEGLGLRPLGIVSVNDVWSAFRLRPDR